MFKKILKNGALLFAVGVALALIAPPLAQVLGPGILGEAAVATAVATPVLWTGAFFGVFGAINTALQPVFDKLFGEDKTSAVLESKPIEKPIKHVHITVIKEAECHKHRELVHLQRQAPSAEKRLS